ncbi:hypothetical protein [Pseudoroseomonas sp. WGS1072]|uniref:hypothetical protein n=1 Tax=Roseomonas sp. WGS1072 TaxID=3366816 RepID=UPI003BF1F61D
MAVQRISAATSGSGEAWQVCIGRGAAALHRAPFQDRAAAEAWEGMASAALRRCTIRIGSKRFLGTAAEALRRWAIDQGTLPRAEGGTQIAPLHRLAGLLAEPECALPLAALGPADLQALRARRRVALGGAAPMLAEQAALGAALAQFCDFHLPGLDSPLLGLAPDGLGLLSPVDCGRAIAWAQREGRDLGLLVGLVLTTGAAAADLLACRLGDLDPQTGLLRLPGGGRILLAAADRPAEGAATAPLLSGLPAEPALLRPVLAELARCLECPGLEYRGLEYRGLESRGLDWPAMQLTGLVEALRGGLHPDEILPLLGQGSADFAKNLAFVVRKS